MKKQSPKEDRDHIKTKMIVLIGVVVIACIIVSSFPSSLFVDRKNLTAQTAKAPEKSTAEVKVKTSPTLAQVEVAPKAVVPSWKIPENTRQLITACLKKDAQLSAAVTETTTLDDLVKSLSAQNDTRHEISLMNIHVRSADSKILRLHLSQKESNNLENLTDDSLDGNIDNLNVQLFSVDKENLPVPEVLPPEMEKLTPSQSIESFKTLGTLVLEESVQKINWENKSNNYQASADVTETNGHIRDMQIFFGNSSLGCAWRNANDNNSTLEDQSIRCKCL